MSLFTSEAEKRRRENLKKLEDRRLSFAERLDKQGFRPERMFFCSREDGSFVALARHEDKLAVIESPKFGADEDFTIDLLESPEIERESVIEKGSGLNGAFGFGTKGALGFVLYVSNGEGKRVKIPVISGRNSWREDFTFKKNPLFSLRRRRGDANVAWDFNPVDVSQLKQIEAALNACYLQ